MATDPISDLRAKIKELESLDLGHLRQRTLLFGARIDLEDLAASLADESDVDIDIVLLVTRAVWAVRLEAEPDTMPADLTVFTDGVRVDVVKVLTAMGSGIMSTGDALLDQAIERTIHMGKASTKVIPVREIMDQARCLMSRPVPS